MTIEELKELGKITYKKLDDPNLTYIEKAKLFKELSQISEIIRGYDDIKVSRWFKNIAFRVAYGVEDDMIKFV